MKRSNLILIIAGILFLTPFLGVPNKFQDVTVSVLSLLLIALIVFSKHLEGSLIKPRNTVEFVESSPEEDSSEEEHKGSADDLSEEDSQKS